MKKLILLLLIIILIALSAVSVSALGKLPDANDSERHVDCTALSKPAQDYYTGDYRYERLATLSGVSDVSDSYTAMQDNALFDALHALMAQPHQYYTTYSGYGSSSLAYYWQRTDAVSGSDTYLMFYSDVLGNAEGATLNREHIWPKSRASYGTKNGGADLHHLRPSLSTVNNAKSNHTFGNVNGVYTDGVKVGTVSGAASYWVMKDKDLFECKDDVKGDVARILLYVYCRWQQPNLYTDIAAENLPAEDADSAGNSGVKVIESLDTLLSWCEEDPVDTWEMRRNDLTQAVQGNRNVFIDYPELAWRLFGKDTPRGMTTPSGSCLIKLLGDVNDDGVITLLDATAIQYTLANILVENYNAEVADADADNDVTIIDATYILRFTADIPQPYPIGEAVVSSN